MANTPHVYFEKDPKRASKPLMLSNLLQMISSQIGNSFEVSVLPFRKMILRNRFFHHWVANIFRNLMSLSMSKCWAISLSTRRSWLICVWERERESQSSEIFFIKNCISAYLIYWYRNRAWVIHIYWLSGFTESDKKTDQKFFLFL